MGFILPRARAALAPLIAAAALLPVAGIPLDAAAKKGGSAGKKAGAVKTQASKSPKRKRSSGSQALSAKSGGRKEGKRKAGKGNATKGKRTARAPSRKASRTAGSPAAAGGRGSRPARPRGTAPRIRRSRPLAGSGRRSPGRSGGRARPAAGRATPVAAAGAAGGSDSASDSRPRRERRVRPVREEPTADGRLSRAVRDIVEVVPDSIKAALAALAALALLLGGASLLAGLRARRLERQRRQLLNEVGLLQQALLPAVPDRVGALRTTVAYRPATGPGAGGDFYDVVEMPGGGTGFVIGDVSGHGHAALSHTAFLRYTLRAYLEAGLEPRSALRLAGRVIGDDLNGDFATVLLAVHDPESGSLTYASAGHPAPVTIGPGAHEPVTVASAPPLGLGLPTGLRQTTVPLASGSLACLFTDGLTDARTADGVVGREELEAILVELGPDATAEQLLDEIASRARRLPDDMAACLLAPTADATAGGFRREELELSAEEVDEVYARRFLTACQVPEREARQVLERVRVTANRHAAALVRVTLGVRRRVEVLPANVESIEAASGASFADRA